MRRVRALVASLVPLVAAAFAASEAPAQMGGYSPSEMAARLGTLHAAAEQSLVRGDPISADRAMAEAVWYAERLGENQPVMRSSGVDVPAQVLLSRLGCAIRNELGDYERAATDCESALAAAMKHTGAGSRDSSVAALELARAKRGLGELDLAERLVGVAFRNLATNPGAARDRASALRARAEISLLRGNLQGAEADVREALATLRAQASGDLELAPVLTLLATIEAETGRLAEATANAEQAVGLLEQRRGREASALAEPLRVVGGVHLRAGRSSQAIAAYARAAEIEERRLALVLSGGTERQQRAFARRIAPSFDDDLSLHLRSAPDNPDAMRLALTTILRRKGRVLDALASGAARIRSSASSDTSMARQISAQMRTQLAGQVYWGSASKEADRARENLAYQLERFEADMAMQLAQADVGRPVTIEAVATALPEGAALVEFATYRPVELGAGPSRLGRPRYAAYLLEPDGAIHTADLGEAAAIDAAVAALRRALATKGADVRDRGRALDALILEPVRRALGSARLVFVAPDGMLNLVPFGALVDARGHYLVEDTTFAYLNSGRELLRPRSTAARTGAAAIVANPDFGAVANAGTAGALGSARFQPLPGTADEGRALASLLPNAKLFAGPDATVDALAQVKSPRILHLATHGFFLPDTARAEAEPAATAPRRSFELEARVEVAHPLLRSGLALAGVNQRSPSSASGVLSALEVTGIDLSATQLVTLSACETGLGEVKNGEGVYGLRRALVLAGAETQVMSLWKVDDAATRDLMIAYYTSLEGGGERAGAMRDVQRALLASPATSHPFYWASFIVSGDPSAFSGKLTVPRGADAELDGRLPPGSDGCACVVGPSARGPRDSVVSAVGPLLASSVISIAVVARRRRRRSNPTSSTRSR